MDLIDWCISNKSGIRISEPNDNMCKSYINMAEESIKILPNVSQSRIWTATVSYYIFYYSLYALMLKIGVKSEKHTCSLEFMKQFLVNFYSREEIKSISSAFSSRIDLQYYSDRPVDATAIQNSKRGCGDFYIKTKMIISKITEKQVRAIRAGLAERMHKTL